MSDCCNFPNCDYKPNIMEEQNAGNLNVTIESLKLIYMIVEVI